MSGNRGHTGSSRRGLGREPYASEGPGRGERYCRCGRIVPDLRLGFWSGVGNYVLIPLFTLGLYVLAVLVGLQLQPDAPVLGVLVMNLPVISLLVTTAVQIGRGHRGTCLLTRSFGWWLWWPGGTISALTFG